MRFLLFLLILSLSLMGCGSDTGLDAEDAYTRCTSVCASVMSEDLEVQWLCYEECKKEFLLNQT